MPASLRIAIILSLFIGFMTASTVAFFYPPLRMVVGPVLCADGTLEQDLPISNRRLNLYCRNPVAGIDREIDMTGYMLVATPFYALLALLPIGMLTYRSARMLARLPPVSTTALQPTPRGRTAERLRELEALRTSGVISAEEDQH
ncbi:MAG TPA: hypothetical protein PKA05_18005, partial [Roseiflexaceae bacterium]|nr:hypothetical protein [Roseiflexaceae bacterium]